jgi:hypothetical protein
MTRRIAATMSFVAFAVCIFVGIEADNPFTTVVSKALLAMLVTFVVGLVLGTMAQKMLDENIAATAGPNNGPVTRASDGEKISEIQQAKNGSAGR